MSDGDLRRILHEIMEDLDTGRLRLPRPRRLIRWIGAPVLAASLGLGVAGCDDRAIGYSGDAGAEVDARPILPYGTPPLRDAGVDAGNIFAYGIPPMLEDAGVDAGAEEWDGGAYDLYGVPFEEADAAVDPPPEALYSAPGIPIDPDAGVEPSPSPTPDPDEP